MNVLDEQIPEDQRRLLRSWRVPVRHIGYDIGRQGIKDPEIIPFLLALRRPTFFSLDFDFYNRQFCHTRVSGCLTTLLTAAIEVGAQGSARELFLPQTRCGEVEIKGPPGGKLR
jgi:hypothetical protein